MEKIVDKVKLVFWEAKQFANKELRTRGLSKPDVVEQIEDYRIALAYHREGVIASYKRVAKNLVALAAMSNQARSVGAAIQAVADGTPLTMSAPPQVGLLVFGFDADQIKVEGIGATHFTKLKEQLGPEFLRTRGNAKNWKL